MDVLPPYTVSWRSSPVLPNLNSFLTKANKFGVFFYNPMNKVSTNFENVQICQVQVCQDQNGV
jgi:hypothetical protein